MKGYKGFNKDLTCRGFQYKEGETYKTDTANLCSSGFHACETPLNVFDYYPPASSVYHEVELDDVSEERSGDTKICAKTIKIGAELSICGLVNAQIEWIKKTIGFDAAIERAKKSESASSAGDQGAASATGDRGAASSTGKSSVALAAGKAGKVMGTLGCAIFAVERGDWDGDTYPIIAVNSAIVDGVKIKPDIWYTLKNGEFVEAHA